MPQLRFCLKIFYYHVPSLTNSNFAWDADDVCFYELVYDVFNRAKTLTDMTEVGLIIAPT